MKRQNQKKRMFAAGYVPRPKGRPRTKAMTMKPYGKENLINYEWRMKCCNIFCQKLEGGETEVLDY